MASKPSKEEHFDTPLKLKEIPPMPVEDRIVIPRLPSAKQLSEWSAEQYEANQGLIWLYGLGVRYNCLRDEMYRIRDVAANSSAESLLTTLQETVESLPYRTGCSTNYRNPPAIQELVKIDKEFVKAVRDCVDGCKYGIKFLTKPTRILKRPDIFKFELYRTTLESVPGRMKKIWEKAGHLRQIYQKRLGDYNPFAE